MNNWVKQPKVPLDDKGNPAVPSDVTWGRQQQMVKAISDSQSLQVPNVSLQEQLNCGKRPVHHPLWHSTGSSQSQIVFGNGFLKAPRCCFSRWWCWEISTSPQNGFLSLWLSGEGPWLNHMGSLAEQAPFLCSVSAVRDLMVTFPSHCSWMLLQKESSWLGLRSLQSLEDPEQFASSLLATNYH